MTTVTLPPELERFATEAVAQGRFRTIDDVVRAGVDLLQRAEAERAAFIASLQEAQAAGRREGFSSIDDVEREMDAIIEVAERRRA